jgi:glycosyltransferase involved in cell wall biosynthesis
LMAGPAIGRCLFFAKKPGLILICDGYRSPTAQSDALNKGIEMARGEYIGILNADDFYEPGVLSRIAAIIKTLSEPRFIVGACNVLATGDQFAVRGGKPRQHP